jgi:ribosomal RNA-processing protein 7
LFVAAVPFEWSESHLLEVMSNTFGDVEEASLVVLDSAPDVAGGLVTFADSASATRAFARAVRGGAPLDPPASLARAVGLEAWVADFRDARPGMETTRARIDDWFLRFEEEERNRANASAKASADDDGWTVVEAKRGRRKTSDGEGVTVGSIRAASADLRRKPGPVPAEHFYRFQLREKRREELCELRAKFTLDKARVAKLKASRKFRPT